MAPGPRMQRINAAVHREPLSSVVYCAVWSVVVCAVGPVVAALALGSLCAYGVLSWCFDWTGANDFDPSGQDDGTELAVVITGCDTGFGRELALFAAGDGYHVFAGCLREESFPQFDVKEAGGRVVPMVMDVTKDGDVSNAAHTVKEWIEAAPEGKRRVLHGLVNNAGIQIPGLFDWLEVSDYRKVMEVNYFGCLRCCKAFLPILKEQSRSNAHRGSRIINVTSIAGILPGNPVGSTYCASKHAAQVITEALRKELAVFGIEVASINPAFHNTSMIDEVISGADIERTWQKMSPELREEYGTEMRDNIKEAGKYFSTTTCWDLKVVVDEVLKTLKARKIPGQVLVGMDARYFVPLFRMMPSWVTSSVRKDERFIPAALKND